MYIIFTYLILFFYDSFPITLNAFVLKNKDRDYCPLYFSTSIENSTTCNLEWYTINDTFNGHKIKCIGRSPYVIQCTKLYNEIDKCYIIDNCLFENFTNLCKDISVN